MPDETGTGHDVRGGKDIIAAAAVFYGGGAVLAGAGALLLPDRLGFRVLPGDLQGLGICVASAVVAAGIVIGLSQALATWTVAGRRIAMMQARAVAGLSVPQTVLLIVAAGIVEEMVFRGSLWTLAASFAGPWPALAVTSILFGAVHGAFRREVVLWSGTAAAAGILAGLLLMWSGALLAPMIMHVIVDAVDMPLLKRLLRTSGGR